MKYPYKNFILKVLKTFLTGGNYSQGGLFKTIILPLIFIIPYSLNNNMGF